MRIFRIIFIFLLLCGCCYLKYLTDPFIEVPNFYKVNENLYRGGQPKNRDAWIRLKKIGIKTVINFTLSPCPKFLKDLEFKCVHIPLSIYEFPKDQNIIKFLDTVTSKENFPVFVYCKHGRDRTGFMIAIYRIIVEGVSIKQAYREALKFGFWPYRGVLKNYLHQIKDREYYKNNRWFRKNLSPES